MLLLTYIFDGAKPMPLHLFEDNDFLTNTFNAIPFPALVVDNDMRVMFWNAAALRLFASGDIFRQKGGDILQCIHSFETGEGCGQSESCKTCIIRNSVNQAGRGKGDYRSKTVIELRRSGEVIEIPVLITTSPFEYNGNSLVLLIIEDIRELLQLGGFLPICSNCKKIRTEENQWQHVEQFIKTHIIDIKFTHGMCPDCLEEFYPGVSVESKK
jgi:hypothetical protein